MSDADQAELDRVIDALFVRRKAAASDAHVAPEGPWGANHPASFFQTYVALDDWWHAAMALRDELMPF